MTPTLIVIPPALLSRVRIATADAVANWRGYVNMNPDGMVLGRVGEYVALVAAGIGAGFDPDQAYKPDGGVDVRLVDVKALTERRTSLMRRVDEVHWTRWYLAVRILDDYSAGYVAGYASRRELQSAPVVDIGYGASYSLPLADLHEGLPPPLRWEEQCDGCGALLDPPTLVQWGAHTYCCQPCAVDEPCGCLA